MSHQIEKDYQSNYLLYYYDAFLAQSGSQKFVQLVPPVIAELQVVQYSSLVQRYH